MIVVAGVFIGLQVSDWNEGRKDAARGNEYLLRLHDELVQDSESLTRISRFWTQVGSNGAAALAVLDRMRRSPELTAELRFWMVNIHNGLSLMRAIQAEATTLARDVLTERDRA